MANEQNLISLGKRTTSEQREIARKGGIASGKKRRLLRDWRKLSQEILALPVNSEKVKKKFKSIADLADSNIDGQTAVVLSQYMEAVKGNTKAAAWLAELSQDIDAVAEMPMIIPDETPYIIPAFDLLNADIKRHRHTHYWCKGGRGSTKSSFVSIKIPQLLMANPNIHAVVMRKVGNTLKNSVYQQIEWAINTLGISHEFKFKKSPLEIILQRTGQRIIFLGVDDKSKIKSLKLPFGYVGQVWYEELDQFAGMEEIRNLNQSLLRGGEKYWCFYSFNPPRSRDNWVNIEQLADDADRLVVHSDYTQVPADWLGEQFILEAEKLKEQRPDLYAHEYMGEVTGTGGAVFENVEERPITDEEIVMFDNIHHGMDFGFARDPFAYTKSHYDEKHDIIYIFDEVYSVGLKNKKAYELTKEKVMTDYVYGDSAEPKTIAALEDYGMRIIGARKGPDSRDYSMKWLADRYKIVIDKKRCPNTYREFVTYEYAQDKDGNFISQYPKRNDHAIDSVRYAYSETMRVGSLYSFD